MAKGKMWFGTFHQGELIDCPVVGSDMTPKSWGSGGVYLSGGAFEASAPDAHKEFSLSWSGASSVAASNRLQAFRDGAYSKAPTDLFYFHDPLSTKVNVLPKRWAQPSLMARSRSALALGEVPGPGVRNLPLTGAHLKAPTTGFPVAPGRHALFVPVPPGSSLAIGVNQTGISSSTAGLAYRVVRINGTVDPVSYFSGDNIASVAGSTAKGILLFLQGEANVFGARAVILNGSESTPPDFKGITWSWAAGMGHSGCRFAGPPTYVPTDGINGGRASFAATLREVGDWLQ